jgi:hypothetical protein
MTTPMQESVPPPTYSQSDPRTRAPPLPAIAQPEIIIVPPTDSMNFQKGFLGADGERAAIEGELQIKGAESSKWSKVCVLSPAIFHSPC